MRLRAGQTGRKQSTLSMTGYVRNWEQIQFPYPPSNDALLKQLTHGWRLPPIVDTNNVTLEIYLDDRFPRSAPRVLWVNAPPLSKHTAC